MEGIVSLTTDCSKIFHETGDHNANVKHTGPQSQFIHLQTLGFSSPSFLYLCAPQQTALEANQPTNQRTLCPTICNQTIPKPHSPIFPLPSSLFPLPSSLFPLPSSLFPLPSSLFPLPSSLFPLPSSLPSSLPHPSPLHPFTLPPLPLHPHPIPTSLHPDKNGNLTFLESRSVLCFYLFFIYLFIIYYLFLFFYIVWFGLSRRSRGR